MTELKRICAACGQDKFVKDGSGRWRCSVCWHGHFRIVEVKQGGVVCGY